MHHACDVVITLTHWAMKLRRLQHAKPAAYLKPNERNLKVKAPSVSNYLMTENTKVAA